MHGSQIVICFLLTMGRLLKSGGHGTRTRNPLRGTTFPVWPLTIRLPSECSTSADTDTVVGRCVQFTCRRHGEKSDEWRGDQAAKLVGAAAERAAGMAAAGRFDHSY
jgi:hypothetical protein